MADSKANSKTALVKELNGLLADHFALYGLQLAFFHEPGELPINGGHCLGSGPWAVVVKLYRVAGLSRDLGDAGPHGACADHCHQGVIVECGHDQRPLNTGVRLFMKALTPSR